MRKVVIANILKPIDDVRTYEKIACSIAKTNKYEVNIIGNWSKKESSNPNIKFLPHHVRSNELLKRFLLRIGILFKVLRTKPSVVVVQTHELLFISLIWKLLIRSKIVYDVREDYKKNIKYLSKIFQPLKWFLSNSIRLKEKVSYLYIDMFWIAEKCYLNDIDLPKNKTLILDNRATEQSRKRIQLDGFFFYFVQ